MANVRKMFVKSEVIRYYKESEFNKIPEKKLMDVVIDIRETEEHILHSWEKHFKSVGVPYAVTKSQNYEHERPYMLRRLWKERVI